MSASPSSPSRVEDREKQRLRGAVHAAFARHQVDVFEHDDRRLHGPRELGRLGDELDAASREQHGGGVGSAAQQVPHGEGLPRAGRPVEQHAALQVLAGLVQPVAVIADTDDVAYHALEHARRKDHGVGVDARARKKGRTRGAVAVHGAGERQHLAAENAEPQHPRFDLLEEAGRRIGPCGENLERGGIAPAFRLRLALQSEQWCSLEAEQVVAERDDLTRGCRTVGDRDVVDRAVGEAGVGVDEQFGQADVLALLSTAQTARDGVRIVGDRG